MSETVMRQTLLRRFREVICAGVAVALWLATWAANRSAFSGPRGGPALAALGAGETLFLVALFALEHRRRRPAHGRRWITLAWASLPIWVCLDIVVAAVLRGSAG